MKFKSLKTLLFLAMSSITMHAQTAVDTWGEVPDLHIEGNHLVDANGMNVMLHGVMDTPSPYFSGYRFGNFDCYKATDKNVSDCLDYFDKLFTAVTDTAQGSWCNVFRLHLDPCWTNNPNITATGFTLARTEGWNKIYKDPNGTEVDQEACIVNFDKSRLESYLAKLYLKIAVRAKNHGMYVILRPPGVCPKTIKVGDYYQQYLINVWDIVTKNSYVLKNSGWLSIELANEPVAILDKNGNNQNSGTTMRDFFQPIVDKIRANGFKGIIWVPGGTWQQEYKAYAQYPVKDDKFGYAVHWYPGWYNTSDKSYNKKTSLNSFLSSVPVAKTHPIMITEVDWSPEDPSQPSKKNEWGEEVRGNYGTWGTGSTSKFGEAYKYVIDYLGNCGMTLTHTHDYIDIDLYLKNGTLKPRFYNQLANNAWEACSGSCFQWYKEYAHTVHEAKDWNNAGGYYFDDAKAVTTSASDLNGKVFAMTDAGKSNFFYCNSSLESPQNIRTGTMAEWGDQDYKYIKFQKIANPGCTTTGNLYTLRIVDESGSAYSIWGDSNVGYLNTPPGGWCLFALGITAKKYGQDGDYYGLWKVDNVEGNLYTIQNVGRLQASQGAYITPTNGTPVSGVEQIRLYTDATVKTATNVKDIFSHEQESTIKAIYDLNGRKLPSMQRGINIVRMANGKVKKIMVR